MTVKDIVIRALRFAGREDIAAALAAGQTVTGEAAETVETVLYCFNAVEDELARYYFPLTATEELFSVTGEFAFSEFSNRPVKILSATEYGKEVEYTLLPDRIKCKATLLNVTYEYAPSKKTLDDDSAFDGLTVSEELAAAGTAAEYCIICGAVQAAETWESRYRRDIDRAQKKTAACASIPPRRWV